MLRPARPICTLAAPSVRRPWCVGLILGALATAASAQTTFAPTTTEYNWSTTVSQLRIKGVHSRGVLGQGATVALLDTGLNLSNPEFLNNPRVMTGYNAVDGSSDVTDNINHGTHVAGVVAAGGNGFGMYGVAPLANLLMVKVFNGGTASASNINRGLDYAMARGARVVNMSFGTTSPLGDTALRRAAASNQAVLVAAAGNEASRNPNWPGHYARESWANGTMLVVGAVDSSNRMASFSNRAGDTAQFYLVAPGVSVLSSYGNSYGYMTGTSMAAPAVSGAAALVTGFWPYLRANQVAAILLNTADDLGAPGVDAIYGHGLLNVNRALSPVGRYTYRSSNGRTVTVALSTQGQSLRQPTVVTPSAFAGLQTEVFDAYGRNFTSDEGQSLQVRTVLTSDMVMGRSDGSILMTQREGPDGARWTFLQQAPATATGRAAPHGVMSPLSAGLTPVQAATSAPVSTHGSLHWQARQGWSFSLGDGGLSAGSLGVMRSDLGRSLGDGGTQVLASPLAAYAPAHRFAVIEMPLQAQGSVAPLLQGARWHARLATLRPDTDRRVRSAEGHVGLGEVNVELPQAVLNLSVGRLQERGLLGGYSSPALGLDAAHQTHSLSLSSAWRLSPGWSALASWSRTGTSAPQAAGLLLGGSRVQADAMGAGLSGQALWRDGDRLSLAWLAPLKARSGQWRYSVVTGVDDAGQPIYGQQTVNLGSGPREWQLDGHYQWRADADASANAQWTAALTWRVHPDHDGSAPSQWAGGLRYQRGF